MLADQEEVRKPVSNHVKYEVEMFNWSPKFHKVKGVKPEIK